MGQVLDRFIRDATLLDLQGESRLREEIAEATRMGKAEWNDRWASIRRSGDPTASRSNFVELLMPVMVADATAVAGVSEGVLFPAMNTALPANFFDAPGKTVRFRAFGVLTTGVTPGTVTFTPRYGTTTGGTTLGAGTVSGTLAASVTAVPWFMDCKIVCSAIGASTTGQLAFFGIWESVRGFTTAPAAVEVGLGARTGVDTTVASGLTVGSTASNAGTSLTARSLSIESLN